MALVLNCAICCSFARKRSLHSKNPCLLLLSQSLVYLAHCLIHALPNIIILIHFTVTKKVKDDINGKLPQSYQIVNGTLIFTAACNVFLFTIAAIERFISLYSPVWHRIYVTKSEVLKAVGVAWFAATTLYAIALVIGTLDSSRRSNKYWHTFKHFEHIILIIILVIVTLLYIVTYILAYRLVHCRSADTEEIVDHWKKELRLLSLLTATYFVYLVGLVPLLATSSLMDQYYQLRHQVLQLIFTLTAVVNPLLMMYMNADFRVYVFQRKQPNALTSGDTLTRSSTNSNGSDTCSNSDKIGPE